MTTTRPSVKDVLTVDDVERLPNGTATIFSVESPQGRDARKATLDNQGYVVVMGRHHEFVPSEWRVVQE